MEKLSIFEGSKLEITMPSLHKVTIREQSAEDDEILGKVSKGDFIDSLNEFVAAIVVNHNYPFGNNGKLTISDVEKMPLRDKHYILIESRIHSIGSTLKFTHECEEPSCREELKLEEDLSIYVQDLSLEEQSNNKQTIQRYPEIKEPSDIFKPIEIKLSSGKLVKVERMTGKSEKKLLQANKDNALTTNTELYARNISIFSDGKWIELSSLNIFSKKDSVEIMAEIKKLDTQYTPITEFKCNKCDSQHHLPVMTIRDFFFPTEI